MTDPTIPTTINKAKGILATVEADACQTYYEFGPDDADARFREDICNHFNCKYSEVNELVKLIKSM